MNKTFTRRTTNNITYQFLTLPGTDLFKIQIVNMMGSSIERCYEKTQKKKLYGISHLIEHLGFRSPKDYTSDELIHLIKTEGNYNASTGPESINYWFKTNSARVELAVNLVCNYALNDLTNISEDEFQTELKVVYNEAKQYADDDQTMFHFNTNAALCGYHVEDNIIGIPETVEKFTLADVINIKAQFLEFGNVFVNVIYDPKQLSESNIVTTITNELERFKNPEGGRTSSDEVQIYNEMMKPPKTGKIYLENDSEQVLTNLNLDVVNNTKTAIIGNQYLSDYAKSSLNDIIREKHGLSYAVMLSCTMIDGKPYTGFVCDVSKGDEELLITLFKESINTSVDNFDEDAYKNLISVLNLKRTMTFVNQEHYDNFFDDGMWDIKFIDKYETVLAKNVEDIFKLTESDEKSFENIKIYLERMRDAVNAEDYAMVQNIK